MGLRHAAALQSGARFSFSSGIRSVLPVFCGLSAYQSGSSFYLTNREHAINIHPGSAPWSNLCKKKRDAQLSIAFWWERVDSNHRSYKQQIYSLSPLATREHSHILFCVVRTPECLFIIAGGRCKCKLFLKKFLIFSIFLLLPSNHLFFSSNHLVFSYCGIHSIF